MVGWPDSREAATEREERQEERRGRGGRGTGSTACEFIKSCLCFGALTVTIVACTQRRSRTKAKGGERVGKEKESREVEETG